MKNAKKTEWYILWILLSINFILLSVGIFVDEPLCLAVSILWSLGILRYYQRITKTKDSADQLTLPRRAEKDKQCITLRYGLRKYRRQGGNTKVARW